jgi:ribosomal protein S27E
MEKLTTRSRVPKTGGDIACPKCGAISTVYHLAWHALGCYQCGAMVSKTDWYKAESRIAPTVDDPSCSACSEPIPDPAKRWPAATAADRDLAAACREWIKGCSCAPADRPQDCKECTDAFLNAVLNRARKHCLRIGEDAL